MKLTCKTCGKPLSANTKKLIAQSTGYCRTHFNKVKWTDASRARLAAAMEDEWQRRLADPAGRAAAVASGKRLRASTPATREIVEKQIAGRRKTFWVPEGYDEMNRDLKRQEFTLAERKRIILDAAASDERRRLAAMTPFERDMERLAKGAGLVAAPDFRTAGPAFTLGGISSAAL